MQDLPAFSQLTPENIKTAMRQIIAESRAEIDSLLAATNQFNWDNLVTPLEEINDRLSKAWSPVSHMNSVVSTDELRQAYNEILPELSQYWTEMGQHQKLYQAFRQIAESSEFNNLSAIQKKVIANILRDFRLSGVALDKAGRKLYMERKQKLVEYSTQFSENVMDATDDWSLCITDKTRLKGLPPMALASAQQRAEDKQKSGWLLTLDFPSYLAAITYADDRDLRETLYRAYVTRASEQVDSPQWDNSELMHNILSLRLEIAQSLGFKNYAEYSLATKMADNPEQVEKFLSELADKSKSVAEKEYQQLCQFAAKQGLAAELQPWDIAYYSEQLKQAEYAISEEHTKPYFPLPKVLKGLFEVAAKLFDIQISEQHDFDRWHQDVQLFEVKQGGILIAKFFVDLYAREKKRGGAWMDECQVRRKLADGSMQLPVAYLICNFTPPTGDAPTLLTHNEVTTLFHEFGHSLHHMLTKIDYADISGINGVAWDAVELPSQFMENWCFQPQALALISGHYQTGEPLPNELLDKMQLARNFQAGMMMVRQLEFALFDMQLHKEYQVGKTNIQILLDNVRKRVAVVKPSEYNRFQHGFSHIFAGGYAAGYYSYKWAEVLSADAFSRFEEEGIFNTKTGADFKHNILEMGGAKEPLDLFIAFRGRKPSLDALLRHSGITGQEQE